MQAIFANFPNKLTLIFPQNIVRQIFHEMSNILYIFRFSSQSRFSRFSADFPVNGFSADSPQLYRIRRFSRFSADFPPDFPLYRIRQIFRRFRRFFRLPGFPPFRQQVKFSAQKKGLDFSSPFLINNLPPVLPEFFLPNSALPHSMPVWAFWRILF